MITVNKYKQNRDDVTCSINIQTDIDVNSDVKQAMKWPSPVIRFGLRSPRKKESKFLDI